MRVGTKHSLETLEKLRLAGRAQHHPTKLQRLKTSRKIKAIRNKTQSAIWLTNELRANRERKEYEKVNPTINEEIDWTRMGA